MGQNIAGNISIEYQKTKVSILNQDSVGLNCEFLYHISIDKTFSLMQNPLNVSFIPIWERGKTMGSLTQQHLSFLLSQLQTFIIYDDDCLF